MKEYITPTPEDLLDTQRARYELIKAMFERSYQGSQSYINEFDKKVADYKNQIQYCSLV